MVYDTHIDFRKWSRQLGFPFALVLRQYSTTTKVTRQANCSRVSNFSIQYRKIIRAALSNYLYEWLTKMIALHSLQNHKNILLIVSVNQSNKRSQVMVEICCSESVLYKEARKRYINAQIEKQTMFQCQHFLSILSKQRTPQETLIRVFRGAIKLKTCC